MVKCSTFVLLHRSKIKKYEIIPKWRSLPFKMENKSKSGSLPLEGKKLDILFQCPFNQDSDASTCSFGPIGLWQNHKPWPKHLQIEKSYCKLPLFSSVQWWLVYPDTFVLSRYFQINEISRWLNRPLVRTWNSVPTLFVRISKISGLSEPGVTNHHCTNFSSNWVKMQFRQYVNSSFQGCRKLIILPGPS